MASGWRTAIEPLSVTQFRRVFVSNFAFFMGMGGQSLMRPWLALQLTDAALALGIVSAAVAVPMLLLAPLGGVLADRLERRSLILASQSIVMLSECIIFGLLVADRLEFWHLVLSASIMGASFPMSMPARQAIVVNIVGKQRLGGAVALNMTGTNVTRVVGPALTGFLISLITAKGAYLLNMIFYGVAVITMLRVARVPAPPDSRVASISANLIEGLRYVRSNRLVLILLVYGLVPMFLAMPFQSLLPFFAEKVWNAGPEGLGILSGAAGTGAVVGSIYVASRSPERGRIRAMMFSAIAFGGLLAGFALSPWFFLAVALVLMANVAVSIFGTLNSTAIQLVIPDHVRGRISSFLMMTFSLPLLGTLPVAAAADHFGAPIAVGVSSVLAVVAAVAFYLSSRELRELDHRVNLAMDQLPD
jgi:MFS transporter, DHA1 family, staphyloferrin A biosynthesis exporter